MNKCHDCSDAARHRIMRETLGGAAPVELCCEHLHQEKRLEEPACAHAVMVWRDGRAQWALDPRPDEEIRAVVDITGAIEAHGRRR